MWWQYLIGAVVTLVIAEFAVPNGIRSVERKVRRFWEDRQQPVRDGTPGAQELGNLESVIFFGAFAIEGAAMVAAAWLAFKVASKWQSWSLFKDQVGGGQVVHSEAELAVGYRIFMVGTAANLVAGMIGAGIARL